MIIIRFFFSLLHFLIIIIDIIIGIIRICKIVTKVVINIRIDINKDNILNINKSGFLIIIIISVNDNNIKQL